VVPVALVGAVVGVGVVVVVVVVVGVGVVVVVEVDTELGCDLGSSFFSETSGCFFSSLVSAVACDLAAGG
jgi:preprotein translocase subunit SecG